MLIQRLFRLALLFLLVTAMASSGLSTPAAAAAENASVYLINVNTSINPVSAAYIVRAIEQAEQDQAQALVMRLDTPGGLDSSMRQIVQRILAAKVPVVVYVAPSGARAGSAGVFITLAAHISAMAPGTNIGAAHPVGGQGEDITGTLGLKIENDAAAYARSIADQRGRNATWAEAAVRQSVSITASEAKDKGVIDLLAPDLPNLLQQIDGREVVLPGGAVTLHTANAPIQPIDLTLAEQFLQLIVDPNVAYIMFTLGLWALIAEFYHPGAILPGVSGVILLLLAFVAFGNLPTNYAGLALIAFAVVFFVLDIHVTGFALSIGGAIAFVLGSLLLYRPANGPATPAEVQVNPAYIGMMTLVFLAFFIFVVRAGLRARHLPVTTGIATMVGALGLAKTALAPQGMVLVHSEDWTAEAVDGPIEPGESVTVVGIDGLKLRVERTALQRGRITTHLEPLHRD